MEIAIYSNHHFLPFWQRPSQPEILFNPNVFDGMFCEVAGKLFSAREHHMNPVLKGLMILDLPDVMAHVSLILDLKENRVHLPKRVWIQITTQARYRDENNLPVVVKNGEVQVKHLWGGDNGTYGPYQMLEKQSIDEKITPEFWKEFFLNELRKEKREAINEYKRSKELLEKFSSIPS